MTHPSRVPYLPPQEREAIAQSKSSRPDVLAALVFDPHEHIRAAVSQNPKTGAPTLTMLARDESQRVRRSVALHQNTSPQAIARLAFDADPMVCALALSNENASSALLSSAPAMRISAISLASNPSTPEEAMLELVSDGVEVREMLARNPKLPDSVRSILQSDASERVLRALESNPAPVFA